ncbi:hypothetical protein [Bradyrhizobium japonicum]|uniref:hypothetical protein n=1 Tax=Bradyrhizobium japonicum TaxID=375 RepID=UPI001BACB475|nr:hypothetical protein [Bradyrhizobium japonicum]
MWTKENRGHCDRGRLHYPSDLTIEEWTLVEPLIAPATGGGGKRTVDARKVANGLMGVRITGWRVDKATIVPCSDSAVASYDQSAEMSHGR